jgi:hypothetical protein
MVSLTGFILILMACRDCVCYGLQMTQRNGSDKVVAPTSSASCMVLP